MENHEQGLPSPRLTIRETRAYAGPSLTTQWIGVCLLSEFDAPRPSPERPASLSAISNGGEAFASYRFDAANGL
jgi:hypothetical protein